MARLRSLTAVLCLVIAGSSSALGGSATNPTPAIAAAAPAPAATAPAPAVANPTVDLGRTAVNGPVTAAIVDPVTGITYLGGHFTEVGERTGPVVAVDPPDLGDGTVQASSPEVVGDVVAVFGDDRAGVPGFIVIGHLTAVNGVAVAKRPAYRFQQLDGRWSLDAAWGSEEGCDTGNAAFPRDAVWIATPTHIVGGAFAYLNPTGITLIERATGDMRILGHARCGSTSATFPSIVPLPELAGCSSLPYCYAVIGDLAFDPTSRHLIVGYTYIVGPTGDVQTWDGVAAYDLTPGRDRRTWTRDLEAGPPPGPPERKAWINALGALPGAFLLRGSFPIDATVESSDIPTALLLDAATGAIRQRWDSFNEQDVETGADIGPANRCIVARALRPATMFAIPGHLAGWTDVGTLCRYRLQDGTLQADGIASLGGSIGPTFSLPSVLYTAPDTTQYLLGSSAAIRLIDGAAVAWDPDPAVIVDNPTPPFVAVAGGSVIVGGRFSFVRGRPSPGVAAVDAAMAPIAEFNSPLRAPKPSWGVEALALSEGRLIVGGTYVGPGEDIPLVALDARTGALDPWTPSGPNLQSVDDIAVLPDGGFWVAGMTRPDGPADALQRYEPLAAGGGRLAAPTFGCLDAPHLAEFGASEPLCIPEAGGRTRVRSLRLLPDGTLYVAGVFGSIDGVARRGLARFRPDGQLDAWDPDLLGALNLTSGMGLMEMRPYAIEILSDRVLVGGLFTQVTRKPDGGGGTIVGRSPLFIFSTSTGALVLPASADRTAWFDLREPASIAFDISHTDTGLFVALGQEGLGIFDATTFELDEARSSAFLSRNWWSRIPDTGIFVLTKPAAGGSLAVSIAAAAPDRVVVAGSFPRWRNRAAGNVVRATVPADAVRPTTTAPKAAGRVGAKLSGSVLPLRVSWSGADPAGSGVRRYELAMSTSGGAYTRVSTTLLRPAAFVSVKAGRTVRFRVRAVDFAGNVGAWTYGPTITPKLVQQTSTSVRFSSGWRTVTSPDFSGGSARARSIKGSSASYTFTGRSVAWVSTMGPTRGKARIYVDGRHVATIDLRAATTRYRTVVWSRSWSTSARHTVRVVVLGTSGRPRVDVDAFVVVR